MFSLVMNPGPDRMPLSTFESDSIAREVTERLLRDHPDLVGIAMFCGGVGGVLTALRSSTRATNVRTVATDLLDSTMAGLLDHTLTMVICHPLEKLAREAIAALVRAKTLEPAAAGQSVLVPFELHTIESI